MRVLLIQHGREASLEVLPEDMEAQVKTKLYKKAHSAIFEHIDKFNKIVLDLENIKVKFEDEDPALLLLTSLPASYEHFVDTLLYGREALTLKDVMRTLNSKKIKERSKSKGDDGKGLYMRGRIDRRDSRQSRGKSRSKYRGGRLKCYICQSYDHLKRNCLKNNRKKSTGYVKKDEQPSSSSSTYDDSEISFLIFWNTMGGSVQLGDNKECKIRGELNASVEEKDGLAQVWHKRLGHISEAGLQVLEKQGLFEKKSLDLWDPSQVESLGGKRYFLSIVDDYSRRTGRTFKKLRTNNGLDFCNQEFEQLCIENGIARHLIVVGTP
nr:retrovirus-related Pol polyprotein from transposon TNT 1-94 [Tanacetum cinerariifolium]